MKLAIVFGAKSFEHEISIVSAISLKKILKSELVYIFCDYDRDFYLIPTDTINAKRFSSGAYKKDTKLSLGHGGFFYKTFLGEKRVSFDVVLNLVHGGDGEDGTLAALFDFFAVPFIGPRLEACGMSYNKLFTKLYAKEQGVKSLDYRVLDKDAPRNFDLDYPVIIKPCRLGSSIGISVVQTKQELDYALDVAFEFDSQVLIEPFLEGVVEYNLAGCKMDSYHFSIVEEPQKDKFLDFDKKYLDFSRTKRVRAAQLDKMQIEALRDAFVKLYEPLFQGALIRCDFFICDHEVYINEINPIPGSMANYLFDDFEELLLGLARFLPTKSDITHQYKYINSIQAAKGK